MKILPTLLSAAAFAALAAGGCSHNKNNSSTPPPAATTPEAADAGSEPSPTGEGEPGGTSSYEPGTTGTQPGTTQGLPDDNAGMENRTNRSNTSESIYPGDAGPSRKTLPEPTAPAPIDDTVVPHAGPPGSGTQPPPAPTP